MKTQDNNIEHSQKLSTNKGKTSKFNIKFAPITVVVLAVIIYFLAQILAVNFLAIYFVVSEQTSSSGEFEQWVNASVAIKFLLRLMIAIFGVGLVYLALRFSRIKWREIGLVRPKLKDAGYALIGYGWYLLLYIPAVLIIETLLPAVDVQQTQQIGFLLGESGLALVLVFFSLVVLPALYEEILTRGYLFSGLRRKLSFKAAAVVTSILFAIAHLELGGGRPLVWIAAIDTFILSMVLVYTRERTGSLWPAIGVHAIKNLAAFMLLFIFRVQ